MFTPFHSNVNRTSQWTMIKDQIYLFSPQSIYTDRSFQNYILSTHLHYHRLLASCTFPRFPHTDTNTPYQYNKLRTLAGYSIYHEPTYPYKILKHAVQLHTGYHVICSSLNIQLKSWNQGMSSTDAGRIQEGYHKCDPRPQ